MLLKRTSKLVLLLTRRQATRLISPTAAESTAVDTFGLTKALGVDVEPNFGPDRKGDIKHSNADISKAKINSSATIPITASKTASSLLSSGIRRICNGDIKKCGKVKRYS